MIVMNKAPTKPSTVFFGLSLISCVLPKAIPVRDVSSNTLETKVPESVNAHHKCKPRYRCK